MQKLVWQNANGDEINLTGENYGITEWEGFSNASLNIQNQQVPFQDGAVFLDALIEPRELSVTLKMQDKGNLEERYRMRRELIHSLNPKLGEGYLIYTNDFISKRIKCVAQIPLFETHNSDTRGTPKASLSWTATIPYWEDLEETELMFSKNGILQIQNEGEIKSQMEIIISSNGELVNPVISDDNGNYIKYIGSIPDLLKINTNFGKKEVCKYSTVKNLLNIISYLNPIYSSELNMFLWYDGLLMTSKDYTNWEIQNAPTGVSVLNTGVYSEHLHSFFLYGYSSGEVCIYSNNGIDWEKTILENIPNQLSNVIYSEERQEFLGRYRSNYITTIVKSVDGLNWQSLYTTSAIVEDIIWSARLGKYLMATDTEIFTSTDGTTWTSQTIIPTGIISLSKFIEGANNIIISGYTNTRIILTSTNDATQWDTTVTYGENIGLSGAYNSKTGFFLIINADNTVLKSSNGISWQKNKIDNILTTEVQYVRNLGLFVTPTGFISRDGIDWLKNFSIQNPELGNSTWRTIYVEKTGVFLAIEYYRNGGSRLFRSKDLGNWSYITLPTTYLRKIIYIDKLQLYLFIGEYNKIFTSKDSYNWEQQITGMANTIDYFDVEYFNNKIIVVGSNGTILISVDGKNWVQKTSGISENLYSISYSKISDIYVIGGSKNNIITSTDCENWTLRTTPDNYRSVNSVIYSNIFHNFVAISASTTGESTKILTSTEGIEWEESITLGVKYQQIKYSDVFNCFFCIGINIAKSVDLINWDNMNITGIGSLTGVTFSGFAEKKDYGVFITGSRNMQIFYKIGDRTNVIQNVDRNSDVNMGLNIGYNRFYLDSAEGDFSVTIRFRQKYLGV